MLMEPYLEFLKDIEDVWDCEKTAPPMLKFESATEPGVVTPLVDSQLPASGGASPSSVRIDDRSCGTTESSDDETQFTDAENGFLGGPILELDDALSDTLSMDPVIKEWTDVTSKELSDMADNKVSKRNYGRKRSAQSAGLSRHTTVRSSNASGELCWKHLIRLLSDDKFLPVPRPDEIKEDVISDNLIFKEMPKRRRPHSTSARPLDKWFNTGGIKSASDRFDDETGLGLRKRYGKIVRQGLPVLRFYEYKLLYCDPKTGAQEERKNSPTLMHIVPNATRADSDDVHTTNQRAPKRHRCARRKLTELRKREAELRRQLAQANAVLKRQAAALAKYRHKLPAVKREVQ
eukprot:COSAG02_NODE_7332_length_3061_cov_1.383862_1_plen_348_part_00